MNEANKEQFCLGWRDCRNYLGEDTSNTNPFYRKGFDACLFAYHNAIANRKGWDAVAEFPSEEMISEIDRI